MHQETVYKSVVVFTFCLCRISRIVSSMSLGSFQVFFWEGGHRFPRICQSLPVCLISRLFLLSFLVSLLFAQLLLAPNAAVLFNNCELSNALGKRLFFYWMSQSDQRKTSSASEDFPVSCQTNWIMTIPWEWGFWGSSPLPIPVNARLLVFTATLIVRLYVFKITWSWGEEMVIEQVKTLQILLFLWIFSCFLFSSINTLQIVASFLLISTVWIQWFWPFFASILIVFLEDQIFRSPYCHLEVLSPQ